MPVVVVMVSHIVASMSLMSAAVVLPGCLHLFSNMATFFFPCVCEVFLSFVFKNLFLTLFRGHFCFICSVYVKLLPKYLCAHLWWHIFCFVQLFVCMFIFGGLGGWIIYYVDNMQGNVCFVIAPNNCVDSAVKHLLWPTRSKAPNRSPGIVVHDF